MSSLTADLILYNANVLTMDSHSPKAKLVAVHNGKIVRTSTQEVIKELSGAKTEAIDCHGMTVLPGFNDAHCHLVAFAESLLTVDLSPPIVHSISDIQNKLRGLSQALPLATWIRAGGYNEFYLAEKRHPTRWELDEATTSHPIKLSHRSGHAHVLNSLALALVGISNETPEPPGGMIERDLETGEPNGVLYGMSNYLANVVPPWDDSELELGIRLANERLVSLGITSIQDASPRNDLRRWRMFQRWKSRRKLRPRVNMMLGAGALSQWQEQDCAYGTGDSQLRLGAIKIILDETRGQLNPPQIELNQKVFEIHQSGLQVALHAVEETTVEAACSALEYALQRLPRPDHRHRVEHCSVCSPEMANRLASLDAIVVTQPAFIYHSGERYLKTVPAKQLKHLYPLATLIEANLKVAAGSDCPVVSPNPLTGIYAAVSRMTEAGQNLLPEQRISPFEALLMYTQRSAYASFEEAIKGSIVPGKHADLVVLCADPTEIASDDIKDLVVEMTIVGGEIVWRRGL